MHHHLKNPIIRWQIVCRFLIFTRLFTVTFNTCIAQASIFEEGVISTGDVFGITFNKQESKLFFVKSFGGRSRFQIWTSDKQGNKWASPHPLFDSLSKYRDIGPFISPDGKFLLFNSDRPFPGQSTSGIFHIWKIDKKETGWGYPYYLYEFNSDSADFFATCDKNSNIYFTSFRKYDTIRGSNIWQGAFVPVL